MCESFSREVRMLDTLYLDESGHAGSNYLDLDQPFHVAAGVLVPARAEHDLQEAVVELRGNGREVKGKDLLSGRRGRDGPRRIAHFLGEVGRAGVIPFYYAMHRPFALAGRLVDAFLDTSINERADTTAIYAPCLRDAIWQIVLTCDDGYLEQFARSYVKGPTGAAFSELLVALVAALDRHGHARLAHSFVGAMDRISDIARNERLDEVGQHRSLTALNLPCTLHVIRFVDQLRDLRGGAFTVVHDRLDQFEDLLPELLSGLLARPSQDPFVPLPDGSHYRHLVRHARELSFSDSTTRPGLQAADVVASAVNWLLKRSREYENPVTPDVAELAMLLLTPAIPADRPLLPRVAHVSAPDDVLKDVGRMFTSAYACLIDHRSAPP